MPTEREYFEELRDGVFAAAKAKGLQPVLPSQNQIQIDIDQKWEWPAPQFTDHVNVIEVICLKRPRIREVLYRLLENVVVVKWHAWKSDGGNCHVMLDLTRELPVAERIAVQAILGSDPMREMLNLRRVWCGAEDPIALFRPQTAKDTEDRYGDKAFAAYADDPARDGDGFA